MRTLSLIVLLTACRGDKSDDTAAACDPIDESGCVGGDVCEEVDGGEPACFSPVAIEGRVFDLTDDDAIAGARVVAMDVNGAPRSAVGIANDVGAYRVEVPTTRTADGAPIGEQMTLRADAAAYQSFPSGLRLALPVDTTAALAGDDGWVLATSATDIGLIAVPDGTGTGAITGTCELADDSTGVLVTAGGATSVADRGGTFAIYNLDAGTHQVDAYAVGLNYTSQSATVSADAATDVHLPIEDSDTATLTGSVQIVNAPGGSLTSVILVAGSTFDANLARGEMPPGLRAGDISGDYSIAGIPRGDWVVLAAFENDGLVRDPDPSIGGTQIQYITVTGSGSVSAEGFKVTEALEIISPGGDGEEQVSDTPTLTWLDDSSEDAYLLEVYDAFGRLVWETDVDQATGDDPSVMYAGPALEPGMYYQLRVTSMKDGDPISRTEDLRGVFYR